jgi:7-cyano-7-deazaguanine synthase
MYQNKLHKVFVLLSGGIDSSTVLAMAADEFPNSPIETVTIDYGQRHKREAACASAQSLNYDATHVVLPAAGLMTGMLVDKGDDNERIPDVSYSDLPEGISPTYVSFRNGLMLSMLAARAQGWVMEQEAQGPKDVEVSATNYAGMHADDAANDAYPDCTLEFAGAMANAIYVGTYFKVRLRVPIIHMAKPDVVAKGAELGVDYSQTWSCYVGAEQHCGVCPTCRARKEAFDLAGEIDPTDYAE